MAVERSQDRLRDELRHQVLARKPGGTGLGWGACGKARMPGVQQGACRPESAVSAQIKPAVVVSHMTGAG